MDEVRLVGAGMVATAGRELLGRSCKIDVAADGALTCTLETNRRVLEAAQKLGVTLPADTKSNDQVTFDFTPRSNNMLTILDKVRTELGDRFGGTILRYEGPGGTTITLELKAHAHDYARALVTLLGNLDTQYNQDRVRRIQLTLKNAGLIVGAIEQKRPDELWFTLAPVNLNDDEMLERYRQFVSYIFITR